MGRHASAFMASKRRRSSATREAFMNDATFIDPPELRAITRLDEIIEAWPRGRREIIACAIFRREVNDRMSSSARYRRRHAAVARHSEVEERIGVMMPEARPWPAHKHKLRLDQAITTP